MQPTLDPEVIKKTFNDALVEVLHEERDTLREVLAEVVGTGPQACMAPLYRDATRRAAGKSDRLLDLVWRDCGGVVSTGPGAARRPSS